MALAHRGAEPSSGAAPELAGMTPRARLLVVDDNPAVRDVWCESLIALGYDVTTAEDGAAALVRFNAAPFDVVLTDLFMPGMDGWKLAEAIWSRSSVPVILITGSAVDADVERARAQGVVLLHKPVHLADFKRVIEQELRGGQGAGS
jgi:two-component system capsular synthesis sensor histidine kinase RcsC